ncbi:MAG: 4'-phosphopantetheinyl transferase superfamily protein, partial [Clostridia bacterium]|nr:4'-phosphopantetheinyl transferase superfamily protein [Clostridia bacterium]
MPISSEGFNIDNCKLKKSTAMIYGIGIDMVEIHRVGELLARHERRFKERVFTVAEWEYAAGKGCPAASLAARWAAKEAAA